MAASVVTMTVNIAASYVLVFGPFGLPSYGVRGAACGAVFAGTCGLLVLVASYLRRSVRTEYDLAHSFHLDREILGRLLRFGSPAGVEFVLSFGGWALIILIFQAQSQIAATSISIAASWDMVVYVPLIGVEIAVTSLVGRYKGASEPNTAHRAAMSGIKVALVYSMIMFVVLAGFTNPLIDVFRPHAHDAVFEQAYGLSQFMVRLMAIYVLSVSLIIAYQGALRGAGDTFWVMAFNVGMHWLMVLMLLFMFYGLHASPAAAWSAIIVWVLLLSLVFHLRYRTGIWRSIVVIGEPEPAA